MTRKARLNLAIILLATGIVINVVVLLQGDVSVGWPIAAIVLLGAAGMTLASERREP